ncbi:MAG TPA: hypothetical protein VII12_18695 [Thermoanaerobaculia bacterium]|jgi:hypothetical protein
MKRAFFLVMTIAVAADAQQSFRQRSVAHPAALAGDWKIEITSSGGITGGGNGGLIVSSDGVLIITWGSTPQSKRCSFQLTADELRTVDAAVRSARPTAWAECYSLADVNTHCCDLIRTTLSLSVRSGRDLYITSWLMEPLPSDLQTLFALLRGPASLDARYRSLCTTMP